MSWGLVRLTAGREDCESAESAVFSPFPEPIVQYHSKTNVEGISAIGDPSSPPVGRWRGYEGMGDPDISVSGMGDHSQPPRREVASGSVRGGVQEAFLAAKLESQHH